MRPASIPRHTPPRVGSGVAVGVTEAVVRELVDAFDPA
jgi:hypothetical protein